MEGRWHRACCGCGRLTQGCGNRGVMRRSVHGARVGDGLIWGQLGLAGGDGAETGRLS